MGTSFPRIEARIQKKQRVNLDISFFSSVCPIDHIFGFPGTCSFNMGKNQWEEACQLFQDTDDDFDWRIGRQSETPGAGPHADHSPGLYPQTANENQWLWFK